MRKPEKNDDFRGRNDHRLALTPIAKQKLKNPTNINKRNSIAHLEPTTKAEGKKKEKETTLEAGRKARRSSDEIEERMAITDRRVRALALPHAHALGRGGGKSRNRWRNFLGSSSLALQSFSKVKKKEKANN